MKKRQNHSKLQQSWIVLSIKLMHQKDLPQLSRNINYDIHNLRRFQEAITQFDLALFIFQDVSYLIKKADSLILSLYQEYQEAITAYEDALLAGTEDTDYIYEKLKSIQIN